MKVEKKIKQLSFKGIKAYLLKEPLSYWLILFYVLLEYVRPQTIYPVLEVLPWSKVTLIATPVAYLAEGGKFNVKNPENKLFVLYFLVIVLSSFFAISFDVAFSKWRDFLILMHVYFLIINIVNTESRFLVFILTFLLYNLKMSNHSFMGWARIGFGFSSYGTGSGPGWLKNSGEFGIQMCMFFPISLYFVIGLKKYWGKWKKLFFSLMPFTALTSMISCSSRGAVVGGAATLLWILMRSKYKFKALLGLIVVAMLFQFALPEASRKRFESSGDDKTSRHRLDRWKNGIKLANKNPLFGVGYENEQIAYRNLVKRKQAVPGSYLCHNIFIQCVLELGYTGLFVFLMMILFTFINNYKTRKISKKLGNYFTYNMAYGFDGALIGFMVSASFVTVLYYQYFWINLAMTVALNNVTNKNLRLRKKALKAEAKKSQDTPVPKPIL